MLWGRGLSRSSCRNPRRQSGVAAPGPCPKNTETPIRPGRGRKPLAIENLERDTAPGPCPVAERVGFYPRPEKQSTGLFFAVCDRRPVLISTLFAAIRAAKAA